MNPGSRSRSRSSASSTSPRVGPVVVEQLKRAGIEATYAEPPNIFDRFFAGDYTGCLFGHGGSYSSDVYYSLRLYQTASTKIPGGHLVNFSLLAQRRVRQTGR